MSGGLAIEIESNAREVLASYATLPERIKRAMASSIDEQNEKTVGHIVQDKLTNGSPEYLDVRTGRLRKSVRASRAVVTAEGVDSGIGSNVVYAGVHEYGYDGTVQVKAHQRRNPQGDRFAQTGGGAAISRARAATQGLLTKGGRARAGYEQTHAGSSYVKAHTRHVKFRARHMFGSGIADRIPDYESAISAAIASAAEEGGAA